MNREPEPTTNSATRVEAALLDYYQAPGKYQLKLRQPEVLFQSIREVLHIAAGRASGDSTASAEELRQAAAFFVRAALLYPGADHYTLLGVPAEADAAQLKERYRLLMRLIHPDFSATAACAWPADAAMRVNRAYEVLSSPVLRREYDAQVETARTQPLPPEVARPKVRRASPGSHHARTWPESLRRHRRAAWVFISVVSMFAVLLLIPQQQPVGLVQKAPATPRQAAVPAGPVRTIADMLPLPKAQPPAVAPSAPDAASSTALAAATRPNPPAATSAPAPVPARQVAVARAPEVTERAAPVTAQASSPAPLRMDERPAVVERPGTTTAASQPAAPQAPPVTTMTAANRAATSPAPPATIMAAAPPLVPAPPPVATAASQRAPVTVTAPAPATVTAPAPAPATAAAAAPAPAIATAPAAAAARTTAMTPSPAPATAPAPAPATATLPAPAAAPVIAKAPASATATAPPPATAPAPALALAPVSTPAPAPAPSAAPVQENTARTIAPSPGLTEVQPLLSQLLQVMESGKADQMLRLLDDDARQAAPAQALYRQYQQLVGDTRQVRLSHVNFKGEPRGEVLVVTGRVQVHVGETTIGSHGETLHLRAEFVTRGGRVALKGLSGGSN